MNQNAIAILLLFGVGALVLFMATQNRTSAPIPRLTPMQYQNEERWEIKRDERGRIAEIVVHRDATIS